MQVVLFQYADLHRGKIYDSPSVYIAECNHCHQITVIFCVRKRCIAVFKYLCPIPFSDIIWLISLQL